MMKQLYILPIFIAYLSSFPTYANEQDKVAYLQQVFVKELADNIDAKFEQIANATTSLGRTYARLYQNSTNDKSTQSSLYLGHYINSSHFDQTQADKMISPPLESGLRKVEFLNSPQGQPSYRAPVLSSYLYNDEIITPAIKKEVQTIAKLAPVFSSFYNMFNDGWVYITTSSELMAIYPFVPADEAVANGTPTKAPFYQAANFKDKKLGWSAPYMDLVGDGLMVTASYPMYDREQLLGVASIDVTIDNFLRTFENVHRFHLGRFLLISDTGMKIADLGSHISETSNKPIYYRTTKGLFNDNIDGLLSSDEDMNSTIESLLKHMRVLPSRTNWHFTVNNDGQQHSLNASKLSSTGWVLLNIAKSQ